MTACHPKPTEARRKVKGAPSIGETPFALLPAVAELRSAKGPFEVVQIFEDNIPESLWPKVLAEMLRRPAMFSKDVEGDALKVIGFRSVANEMGAMPAFENLASLQMARLRRQVARPNPLRAGAKVIAV